MWSYLSSWHMIHDNVKAWLASRQRNKGLETRDQLILIQNI